MGAQGHMKPSRAALPRHQSTQSASSSCLTACRQNAVASPLPQRPARQAFSGLEEVPDTGHYLL